ncbi:Uma2 family endonuclease [Thermomonospora cellulosilytica]|uniref:Uma2 family endonuclease n=1 Tax=Thermomonospora cellulosilytica TaxID=1411118 RepID=A0A7W3RCA7_9ACTN|nr:Uma2 family endonuclease [Thermomonospora cellulosilytica]MBA9007892.1 Uma2 family endonuclease [Thermomonospora cellulosilytica]
MTSFPEWMLTLPEQGLTAEEYDRMPEESCRNIEIVDGRIVVVPSATPAHNRLIWKLAHLLEQAAPAPWQVTVDVDLRISDVPLNNRRPDVLVFQGDPDSLPVRPPQVLLAVEVMSKGSVSTDRLDKPAEYAAAGIPHYWRVEREGAGLIVYTHVLNRTTSTYADAGAYSGLLKVEQPYPVEMDLNALL